MGVKVGFLLLILAAFSVLGSADPAFSPKQAPSRFNKIKRGKIETLPRNEPYHNVHRSSIALPPSIQHESPSPLAHRNHHYHKRTHHGIPKSFHLTPRPSYAPSAPSPMSWDPLAPAPSPIGQSSRFQMASHPPATSPLGSHLKTVKAPHPPEIMSLPPPPPNRDCPSLTCTDPLTYTPPGTFCGCVWPIQVKLQLGVAIYTFFTMVTELAEEIGASVALNHTQVRIMGANAGTQHLEKSVVLINLVPEGLKFTEATAFSIYQKFWRKKVLIKPALFGSYEVLYVRYPGLPPSPPSPLSISTIADKPLLPGGDQKGGPEKPLGVDVSRRRNHGLGGGVIALIVVSSFAALCTITAIAWLLVLKCGNGVHQNPKIPQSLHNTPEKPREAYGPVVSGKRPNSASNSFRSGPMTYAGSAKVFAFSDIVRATNNFDPSKVLGEGGFGLVYSGKLDDDRMVAVKVLKREGQHGTREFLAEVEMLSRLHHRNLVKLIGICTEENARCLVYELIPNGSVESHLHGVDKERDPLDWDARMKTALGAARGLAYLHEDSSPRVIHRDFKSSNILLEHDFTPKVSDFGLARAALEEGNKLISTHVMGTFGYLAPEYAMTGHLLVKSDVYSYGVVLLELLTGRKPVDFTQPPGQENLVAYARPLLTSKDGLETIVDPTIKPAVSYDTLSKVAAIASMCVQPEVSHRPFMGEVVQALKLVCNEFDDTKDHMSRSLSRENLLIDVDSKSKRFSGDMMEVSKPELFSAPIGLGLEEPEMRSFARYSSSGPLRTGSRSQFWERTRSMSRGSASERGFSLRFWSGNN